MQYQPMTDEEIAEANLIKDGTKLFAEVKESADHVGKDSGKESIRLVLNLWEGAINRGYITVFITPAFMLLFKHACYAMIDQATYESGNIQAVDFEGKSCNVVVGIKKDKTGQYPDKNIIKDFISSKHSKDSKDSSFSNDAPPHSDDDLPF